MPDPQPQPEKKPARPFKPQEYELLELARKRGKDISMADVDRLIVTLNMFMRAEAAQEEELKGLRAQTGVLHALMHRWPTVEFTLEELAAAQKVPVTIRFIDVPPGEKIENGVAVVTPAKMRVERHVVLDSKKKQIIETG